MPSLPTPTPAASKDDIRAFFDQVATEYTDRHGPAEALLAYRLAVLDHYAQFSPTDVVLDVGCGGGAHLRALADRIERGIGIDFSPQMIATARRRTDHDSLTFRRDDAEQLDTIPSTSIDKVICVGVLEHLLHPRRVVEEAARVLRPDGRFVALTLNGACWWYRLADRFGLPTRHLETDRRLRPNEATQMLEESGFQGEVDFWRFVPAGDLPGPLALVFRALDRLGQRVGAQWLRGGLCLHGRPR